jgi:uncharacterized protein (TIGR02594 family)
MATAVTPARLGLVVVLWASCAAGQHPSAPSRQSPPSDFVPKADPNSDERPWAAAFINYSLEKAGVRGTRSPNALSFLTWGVPLDRPVVGAIAVLDYGAGRGHVGMVEGKYNGMIVLLGGNQNDSVSRTAFPASEIAAYRWPEGQPGPSLGMDLPTVRPTGASETAPAAQRQRPRQRSKSSEIGTTVTFQATPNGQRLTIARIDEKRVRFELKAGGTAGRSISGIAYVIYDGDVEIESDEGIGYAADQLFFWGDGLGKQGVSIRLSLFQPDRARVLEWGTGAASEKGIMREAHAELRLITPLFLDRLAPAGKPTDESDVILKLARFQNRGEGVSAGSQLANSP